MVDDIRPRPELPKTNNDEKPNDSLQPIEQFADQDNQREAPIAVDEEGFVLAPGETKKKFKNFWRPQWPHVWWRNASKKERIIASTVVAVMLIASGGALYALTKKDPPPPPPAPVVVKKVEPPKTTEPSRLTGVEIPIATNKRPVVAIQIENSPDARPQAGLKDAGIVFEAIAEGGITRFNAMYLEGQPDYIGPVRSIRPYYIDFFAPFDAALVHAGGSAEGLAKVRDLGIKDLDHSNTPGAFRRVSDRYAPHNLYTSMAELDKASAAKGYTKSTFKSWPRKAEKKNQPIKAKAIDFNISSALYNVHYDYDPAANNYHRSMGGRAHNDHRSGQLITPKVVVALVMGYAKNGIYSVYQTTGSGEMYVFQDGQIQKGTWKKAGTKDQFQFIAADGKPLALNPGQTWVSVLRSPAEITHTP